MALRLRIFSRSLNSTELIFILYGASGSQKSKMVALKEEIVPISQNVDIAV